MAVCTSALNDRKLHGARQLPSATQLRMPPESKQSLLPWDADCWDQAYPNKPHFVLCCSWQVNSLGLFQMSLLTATGPRGVYLLIIVREEDALWLILKASQTFHEALMLFFFSQGFLCERIYRVSDAGIKSQPSSPRNWWLLCAYPVGRISLCMSLQKWKVTGRSFFTFPLCFGLYPWGWHLFESFFSRSDLHLHQPSKSLPWNEFSVPLQKACFQ